MDEHDVAPANCEDWMSSPFPSGAQYVRDCAVQMDRNRTTLREELPARVPPSAPLWRYVNIILGVCAWSVFGGVYAAFVYHSQVIPRLLHAFWLSWATARTLQITTNPTIADRNAAREFDAAVFSPARFWMS
jgi:hypothetical protein